MTENTATQPRRRAAKIVSDVTELETQPVVEEEPVAEEDVADEVEDDDDTPIDIEDLDPESELWPSGPLVKQVVAWKEQYGDVYVTSINLDTHIMWRPMTRSEYKNHVRHIEQNYGESVSPAELNFINEELLTEMCLLFPTYADLGRDRGLAGVPSLIAQEVMEASGFVALDVRQL